MSFPQRKTPISLDQLDRELSEFCQEAGIENWSWTIHPPLTQEHKRNSRRYAQMYEEDDSLFLEFADQIRWLHFPQRAGLYIHEIGHFLDPDPRRTEDGADVTGMRIFDVLLVYDHRWPGKGLQTAIW